MCSWQRTETEAETGWREPSIFQHFFGFFVQYPGCTADKSDSNLDKQVCLLRPLLMLLLGLPSCLMSTIKYNPSLYNFDSVVSKAHMPTAPVSTHHPNVENTSTPRSTVYTKCMLGNVSAAARIVFFDSVIKAAPEILMSLRF